MDTGGPGFGFGMGGDHTWDSFRDYARLFEKQYFDRQRAGDDNVKRSPEEKKKVEDLRIREIEGEFWRIVEDPTHQIEVRIGGGLGGGEGGGGKGDGDR